MKKPQILEMILEHVEQEVENEWKAPRESNSFRASELGDCPRALQYSIRGAEKERPGPELELLFRDGHLHHHALRTLLKGIGTLTNEEHHVSKKYRVPVNGQIVDLTITATTDCIFEKDFVIDIKSINFFSFKQLSRDWILANHYDYVIQIQTYLDIYDKEWGALLFKDKMTSALKIFWFKKDPEMYQRALKKMARIQLWTDSGKLIKRPFTASSTECKRCWFRKVCRGKPMERRTWS